MEPELSGGIAAVADPITVDTNWQLPNCFVSFKYFDADPRLGAYNIVTPGAGAITVQATIVVNEQPVDITDGTFDCTVVNSFASYVGNSTSVTATPSGITTATFYELLVSQNAV